MAAAPSITFLLHAADVLLSLGVILILCVALVLVLSGLRISFLPVPPSVRAGGEVRGVRRLALGPGPLQLLACEYLLWSFLLWSPRLTSQFTDSR